MSDNPLQVTRIGIFPLDWDVKSGGEITQKVTKGASPKWQGFDYQTEGMLFITSENVRAGYLDVSNPKYLPLEFHERLANSQLQLGDILINIVGASIGRSCIFDHSYPFANINQAVCLFRTTPDVDPVYILNYLQWPKTVARLVGTQSETARPNLTLAGLKNFKFALPPLSEQRAIADILSTWDEAIAIVEMLIAAVGHLKKGLMQQLLTGQTRFPEFDGEWESKPIGDLLKEIRRRVKVEDDKPYHLLSVRRRSGGVFFRETRLGNDLTEAMYEVRENDFLISKRQIVHGASALATDDVDGFLVSNAYHVLAGKNGNSIRFFNWLSKTPRLYHLSYIASHGVHIEKLFFVIDAYLRREVDVPPTFDEQEKIADLLDTFEDELDVLHSYGAALREQKRGLMQQLLTGQIRVGV